jgi:hypothetical protein
MVRGRRGCSLPADRRADGNGRSLVDANSESYVRAADAWADARAHFGAHE